MAKAEAYSFLRSFGHARVLHGRLRDAAVPGISGCAGALRDRENDVLLAFLHRPGLDAAYYGLAVHRPRKTQSKGRISAHSQCDSIWCFTAHCLLQPALSRADGSGLERLAALLDTARLDMGQSWKWKR